jgi:hypothetical protein
MVVQYLLNFEISFSKERIILEYSIFSFTIFCYLKKNPENFNISNNNIINGKATKVVGYLLQGWRGLGQWMNSRKLNLGYLNNERK